MKQNIASKVAELIAKPITDAGFTVWDIRFEKDAGDMALVIELDRGENMSMTDCEEADAIIEPIIDENDPIEGAYVLEVSSAGLTRILRTDLHFEKAIENRWNAKIKTFKPIDGKKEFDGIISAVTSETVTIGETVAERKNIAQAVAILG